MSEPASVPLESVLQPELRLIQRAWDAGLNIMVVGVKKTNLPDEYFAHPRVTCIDGFARTVAIPFGVGVVLFTRFIHHALFENVRIEMRKRHLDTVSRVLNTGQIRRLLAPFVHAPLPEAAQSEEPMQKVQHIRIIPSERPAPTPEPPPRKVRSASPNPKGALRDFVLQHLDLTAKPGAEVKRLVVLANASGLKVTNLNSTYHRVREHLRAGGKRTAGQQVSTLPAGKRPPAAPPERETTEAPEIVVPAPQPFATLAETPANLHVTRPPLFEERPRQAKQADEGEVLRLIDDAIAALQLAREHVVRRDQVWKDRIARLLNE